MGPNTTAPAPPSGASGPGAGTLGRTAARGVSWLLLQSLAGKLSGVAGNLVLGWLLAPEAFGLVGMAYSVSIFVSLVSQAGLREVLTQRHRKPRLWITPGFWLSVVTGITGMALLLGLAPLVARVFGEPQLVGLLGVLALTTLMHNLGVAADAQLHAQLRFGLLGSFGVINVVGKTLLTIALALLGFGAYSIVLPGLVFATISAIVFWWHAPVRPEWSPRASRWKYLIGSSVFVFGATGLYTLMTQSSTIFLGLFQTTAAVGLFYFAFALALQPLMILGHAVRRVLLPTLARLNANPVRQALALERSTRLLMLAVIPLAWFQIPLAQDFMRAVFPERWAPAAVVLQMLSIAIPLRTLGWTGGAALQAQARFKTQFKLSVVAVLGSMGVASATAYAGPVWMVALGFSLFVMVLEPATYALATRRPTGEALRPFAAPLIVGALATGVCWVVAEAARPLHASPWLPLTTGAAAGLAAYALLIRSLLPQAWGELIDHASHAAPAPLGRAIARLSPPPPTPVRIPAQPAAPGAPRRAS